MAKQLDFDIFSHPCVARVRVWALLDGTGEIAGRIIWAYPNDGAGIVKCQVSGWTGLFGTKAAMRGNAGGFGYDKASAAFADALDRAGIKTEKDLSGRGDSAVREYLESLGYIVIEAL
jgi:hypothetical protein